MIVCLAPSPVCRSVIKVKILKFYDLGFACCYLNSNQIFHLGFFLFCFLHGNVLKGIMDIFYRENERANPLSGCKNG